MYERQSSLESAQSELVSHFSVAMGYLGIAGKSLEYKGEAADSDERQCEVR